MKLKQPESHSFTYDDTLDEGKRLDETNQALLGEFAFEIIKNCARILVNIIRGKLKSGAYQYFNCELISRLVRR